MERTANASSGSDLSEALVASVHQQSTAVSGRVTRAARLPSAALQQPLQQHALLRLARHGASSTAKRGRKPSGGSIAKEEDSFESGNQQQLERGREPGLSEEKLPGIDYCSY